MYRPERSVHVTYCLVCNWECLWKSLSLQHNFVTSTSHTNSVWFDFLKLVTATKFCCRDKDFHKNSPVHMKRFDNMLRQLVTKLVDKEWTSSHHDVLLRLIALRSDLKPHAQHVFFFFFLARGACACMSSRQAGERLKSRVESLYGVFPVPLGQFTSVTYPRWTGGNVWTRWPETLWPHGIMKPSN